MNDDDKQSSAAEAELERKIRQGRKFTAREAMGRMLGPGTMKGGSAVSRVQQAETEIGTWLGSNLTDSTGALQALLHRQLKESPLLLNNLDRPARCFGRLLPTGSRLGSSPEGTCPRSRCGMGTKDGRAAPFQ